MILGFFMLKNKVSDGKNVPSELRIWIYEWTTESYSSIIEGFKKYAPEYKNTQIIVEKKTSDLIRYRTLILSSITDEKRPDIFMLWAGTDKILEQKIEPIPSTVIDIASFEKEYNDIFMRLVQTQTEKKTVTKHLLWVPLGFETQRLFYNKNLVREYPRTWNDFDRIQKEWISSSILASNLWFWPRYTPNAIDVLGLFYEKAWQKDIMGWAPNTNEDPVSVYVKYGEQWKSISNTNDPYSTEISTNTTKEEMDKNNLSTFDLFMKWKIWMIFGYPSTILDLEKSDKRVGVESQAQYIMTTDIPLEDSTSGWFSTVQYAYFWLSQATKSPTAGAKFLSYLMTDDAISRYLSNNSTQIAAKQSFWEAQKNTQISSVFPRITLGNFIPKIDEQLFLFEYALKPEFNSFLTEYLDRSQNIDISNISKNISFNIGCTIDAISGKDVSADCERKE